MNSAHPTEETGDASLREQDMAVPEVTVDKEEAADIKRTAIYALNEIADLHERVRKCVPFSEFRCLFRLLLQHIPLAPTSVITNIRHCKPITFKPTSLLDWILGFIYLVLGYNTSRPGPI